MSFSEIVEHNPIVILFCGGELESQLKTRMHSSRMRTAHSLTVARSIWWGGLSNPPWMQTPSLNADPPGCRSTPRCRPTPFHADPFPGCRPPSALPSCEQNDWLTCMGTWPSQTSFAVGNYYRPQTKFAKVTFFLLPVDVDNRSSRTEARCEWDLINVNRL